LTAKEDISMITYCDYFAANYLNISIVKPTRSTIFEFIEYHSTCFGRSFRPSSGVQDCTHSIRYMSYRLVDCMLEEMRCFISCPLAVQSLTLGFKTNIETDRRTDGQTDRRGVNVKCSRSLLQNYRYYVSTLTSK